MTTIDTRPEVAHDSTVGQWLAADADWLTTSDHKKIGRMFIGGGLLGLLATIVVNLVISIERVDGGAAALDADSWLQLLSAQRVGLIFGTALPLAAGMTIAVVPLQLGARALAFPRLAAMGMYAWLGGLILSIVSLASNGGLGGGDADMVDLFLAAHALMAIGFTAVGISLIVSVLTTRAPGMTMRRVPFFTFSALVFGIGLVLVMPVLVGTIIYLFVDHRSGAREAFGGNEGIVTWAGWIFTQPTSFLFAIPAFGVFAELAPVTFRKRTPLRGAIFGGLGLVGVSALAAVTQQLRFEVSFDSSDFAVEDLLVWAMFLLVPLLGAVILLLMALFLAKPEKDDEGDTIRPNITGGFLFAFFGFGMVLVGMLGAALEPIADFDLVDTVFTEASLVYVAYGAALGVFGGVVFWAPKLWGRTIDLKKAAPLALLGVLGTVLASFPYYLAGFLDQPAGFVYDNDDLQIWNVLVLIGNALMVLAVLGFIGLLVTTMIGSESDAPDDPYDAHTIEWATTSPAPPMNFVDVPTVQSSEPMLDLREGGPADDADETARTGSAD